MSTTTDTRTTTGTGREAPHSFEAEEHLLGAAMLNTEAFEICVSEVDSDDFYRPAHQRIHEALRSLWETGILNPDAVLVGDELGPAGLEAIGGPATLALIVSACPATSLASHYAAIILEHATRRRLIRAGAEVMEMGYHPHMGDVALACERAVDMVGQVELPIGTAMSSPTITDFLATETHYDWQVPGLLERGDRLILTASEGGGKSTMLRQMAVQFAAGMHPFKYAQIDPLRVLLVDLENSANQARRKIEPLYTQAADRIDPDMLQVQIRSEGIDLTQRHDSRWLLERCAATRPDVLIIGPIYRMSTADPSDDTAARAVIRVLDMIRSKYGCTLIIEGHAGHGTGIGMRNLRPIGASIWKRWPEFGYGIQPDKDSPLADDGVHRTEAWFSSWRGDRDEREWPSKLRMSPVWPWQDAGYHDPRPIERHDDGIGF